MGNSQLQLTYKTIGAEEKPARLRTIAFACIRKDDSSICGKVLDT